MFFFVIPQMFENPHIVSHKRITKADLISIKYINFGKQRKKYNNCKIEIKYIGEKLKPVEPVR